MPGILELANIYAKWVQELSVFWDFLNSNLYKMLETASNHASDYTAKAAYETLLTALRLFGAQDQSILMFILSIAGTGFTIYFLWTMLSYILDLLP